MSHTLTGGASIIDVPDKDWPLPPKPEGMHKHKCHYCGMVWQHSDACDKSHNAVPGSHECPGCHRCNWELGIYDGPEVPKVTWPILALLLLLIQPTLGQSQEPFSEYGDYEDTRKQCILIDFPLFVGVGCYLPPSYFPQVRLKTFPNAKVPSIVVGVPYKGELYRIQPDLPAKSTQADLLKAVEDWKAKHGLKPSPWIHRGQQKDSEYPTRVSYETLRAEAIRTERPLLIGVTCGLPYMYSPIGLTMHTYQFEDTKTACIVVGVPFKGELYRVWPDLPQTATLQDIVRAIAVKRKELRDWDASRQIKPE